MTRKLNHNKTCLRHSGLRIWDGHLSGLGCCCGAGSIPGLGTLTRAAKTRPNKIKLSKKWKKKKQEKKPEERERRRKNQSPANQCVGFGIQPLKPVYVCPGSLFQPVPLSVLSPRELTAFPRSHLQIISVLWNVIHQVSKLFDKVNTVIESNSWAFFLGPSASLPSECDSLLITSPLVSVYILWFLKWVPRQQTEPGHLRFTGDSELGNCSWPGPPPSSPHDCCKRL